MAQFVAYAYFVGIVCSAATFAEAVNKNFTSLPTICFKKVLSKVSIRFSVCSLALRSCYLLQLVLSCLSPHPENPMSFPKKPRQFSRSSEVSAAAWSLLLLAIVATPLPLATALLDRPVFAQSPSPAFPLPTAVPSGTTVRINGSSSLESVNEALKQRFESQFSGTEVEAAYDGSDEALQQLLNGSIDLAAIGRPLTEQEQAQGLVAVPVARNKIAVVVGNENPFNDSLTSDQFARIFRGEVTSWSQVGGEPTPIRFIDRPEDSDIRRSFQQYPVFQTAPFAAGANAVELTEDTAEAVADELAADGIGYVIADQLAANPNLRALLLHDTPPTDPLYPFSQPLSYVYRGPNPSPEVQAFLGYAAAPENQPIVEEARRAGVAAAVGTVAQASPSPEATPETSPSPEASPSPAVSPTPEATADPTVAPSPDASPTPADPTPGAVAETDRAGAPWWLWLLAIPLLGALLWWLLRDRSAPVPPAAVVPPVEPGSRMILTPRNCREGYVYWEVPDRLTTDLRSQNRLLKVRLHDVTEYGITDYHATNLDLDRPRSQTQTQTMTQFDCDERSQDLHISIPVDNRDYVAELGYFVDDDRWVRVAQSAPVRVPACEPVMPRRDTTTETASAPNPAIPLAGAATALGVGAAGAAAARSIVNPQLIEEQSRIILTPRSPKTAYVYWEVPKQHKESLRQQGGRDLRLRIYDTTGIDIDEQSAHSMREYRCDELAQDMHVPIPATDRDYVAELGYVTEDRRWLRLARSAHVHMPVMPLADRGNDGTTGVSIPKPPDATGVPPVRPIPRTAPPETTGAGVVTGATSPTSPASPTTQSTDLPSRTTSARADDRRRDPNTISDATKAAGAALAGGAAAVGAGITQAVRNRSSSDIADDRDSLRGGGSVRPPQRRIILVPRSSNAAYAYWEVSEDYKDELRRQGGQILMLRIHDATDLDIDYQPAHSTQDYVCDDNEQDKHVTIPVSDRDYVAELGYVTDDGRWLRLIRSLHIRVPSDATTL
jgi:phosphate transport system substrate-binding protein